MKRKNIKGIFTKSMDANADPIVESKNLQAMPQIEQKQPGQIKNPPTGKGFMPVSTSEKSKVNKTAVANGLQMAPFTPEENRKINFAAPDIGYHNQVEKKTRKAKASGYIVLRMRVQNGQVSVINSRKVEGDFLEHENLIQSGITYEAFLDSSRIAIGSIPDFGEQRSFARPDGDAGHEGHHITILPSFDFNLKIPANKIALHDLPTLKLSLYRFKEHVPNLKLAEAPLKMQFTKEVRVVAEMNGIRLDTLDDDVAKQLKKILKD